MGSGEFVLIGKSQARLDILIDNSTYNTDNRFIVEKDINLNTEIAKLLGVKSVTIRSGNYKVDFSKFALGSVILDVVTQ